MMSEDQIREVERLVLSNTEWRLRRTLNLIASENVLSARARALLPSDFGHRYAEGHPGARYYQGTADIDVVEAKVRDLFLKIFDCRRAEVRTVSGTNANDVVFSTLAKPEDRVVVNSLTVGGHISHQLMGGLGKYTRNILPWPRSEDGYRIDPVAAKDMLAREKPKAVFMGKSMILFPEPVRELAPVCRELGITMVYDGAHVLGLIAGGTFQAPLKEGCDILLGSTHKTFFGPQRGVILSNSEDDKFWKRIDKTAFPGSLSNHHLFTLPPLLVAATEMEAFGKEYAAQVVANAKHFAASLAREGFDVQCAELGYTESHQVVVDVSKHGGGGKASVVLEQNDIITNRNLLPWDPPKKVNNPSGIRLGVQEMTRWGMKGPEMEEMARLMKACVIEGKAVKEDVNRFRGRFVEVGYSFDPPRSRRRAGESTADPVEVDLSGY